MLNTRELIALIGEPYKLSSHIPDERGNWILANRIIATSGLVISCFYALSFYLLDILPSSGVNLFFAGVYSAFLAFPVYPLSSIGLMFSALVQASVVALFFSPAGTGGHYFLLVMPVLSLVAIHHRHRIWWWVITGLSEALLVWMCLNEDTYEPPFTKGLDSGYNPGWRALALIISITLIIFIMRQFHASLFIVRQHLKASFDRSESLLRNLLPAAIAERLKNNEDTIADHFDSASVLFADLVGFTKLTSLQPPSETVFMLNTIFSRFDKLVDQAGLEKIKTIGDSYMVAGGVPSKDPEHLSKILHLSLQLRESLNQYNHENGRNLALRIGVSTGPLVAGVIGTKKLVYDIWGDSVNMASRMESTGIPGRIQVTKEVTNQSYDRFAFTERGPIEIKGKGLLVTYFLDGPRTNPTI